MLEKRNVEGVYFDVDWMTRCVAGEWQAGESIGVSVLVHVPVLDTVPLSGEEQGIPLQTSGSHSRQVLLRIEDSGEGFVICNEHKIATIQTRVKLTHSPDNGEGFFVDLRAVSLRSRQRSRCKSDRAFGAIRKHVRHHCADAARRGIAGEAQRQGWVKMGEHQIRGDLSLHLSKAWWQAEVHLQAVPFCRSAFRGWSIVERLGKKRA